MRALEQSRGLAGCPELLVLTTVSGSCGRGGSPQPTITVGLQDWESRLGRSPRACARSRPPLALKVLSCRPNPFWFSRIPAPGEAEASGPPATIQVGAGAELGWG